ncbi:MAG: RnfABCDGE type electron transport complex subunit G [Clostridia bacterium]|nr:RnfABCDGE type electron transport complex subunit G [Clostridia bacterium]
MPEIAKLGLKLFLLAAVAGLALGITNEVTKGPIEKQKIAASNAARIAVLPEGKDFEPIVGITDKVDELFTAKDENGNVVGHTGMIKVQGFGGPIEVTVGVNNEGTVTGISVGGSDFQETAGLGAKTKDAEFTDRFKGIDAKTANIAVAADGGVIEAVTGATISSRAVSNGVKTVADAILALN